jgi:hypothetical protein
LERLARQLEIDPGNARRVFQKGYGGIGDRGRWHLIVEETIERLIPESAVRPIGKVDKVLEILQDGQWHTAPELRQQLRVSSINPVLKELQHQSKVELTHENSRYRARLLGPNRTVQPLAELDVSASSKDLESPYTPQSKLSGIFEDLRKGLPEGEIENRAHAAGMDPANARLRLIRDGTQGLRGWKWVLHEENGREYVKITQSPTSGHD